MKGKQNHIIDCLEVVITWVSEKAALRKLRLGRLIDVRASCFHDGWRLEDSRNCPSPFFMSTRAAGGAGLYCRPAPPSCPRLLGLSDQKHDPGLSLSTGL